MNCEICATGIVDNINLWECAGCPRRFHAACIGVHRNKVVEITSYVLPCCSKCQSHVRTEFDIRELTQQQSKLAEQLQQNTEIIHRLTQQQKNVSIIHEAMDRLEGQLVDLKREMSTNRSNNSATALIKNHITSLIDIAMINLKENNTEYLKSITSNITRDVGQMREEIEQLGNLSLEIAANINDGSQNAQIGMQVLDEVKMLSTILGPSSSHTERSLPPPPESSPSLAEELSASVERNTANSGWRVLGSTRRWKADWTEYDARQLRRLNQQKEAEKARNRRRRHQMMNQPNRNNRRNVDSRRNYSNYVNRYTNNNNNARHRNIRSNSHINNIRHHNPNRYDSTFNMNNIRFNSSESSSRNNNQRRNNINNHQTRNNTVLLPPDRVLLAAAKHQFSRPPETNPRMINFQRGEVLNPYPVDHQPPHTTQLHSSSHRCMPCCCTTNNGCSSFHHH